MGLAEFKASLAAPAPPERLTPALAALWHAANGNWQGAHELAQQQRGKAGAWVHAYLHRLDGDDDNARYWYGVAGRPVATASREVEWEQIATALLSRRKS